MGQLEGPVCTVIEEGVRGVGWELRWGAGEEKVKGRAKMDEGEGIRRGGQCA